MSIFQRTFSFLLLAMVFVSGFFVTPDFTPEVSNSVIAFDIGISEVSASGTGTTDTTDAINEWMATFAKFFNMLLGVVTVLVTPVIMFAGWLLSPDWITGKIFGLQEPMYKMWTTVANIVYFVYAILLIFVAIATIFNSQNYGYKTLLPRLFLGIIMVPFTWWFVQFIISVSTIVTSAVMEIPYQTMNKVGATNSSQADFWEKHSIPRNIDVNTFFTASGELAQQCKADGKTGTTCASPKEIVGTAGGVYSPLLTYSYGIFKIQELKTINTNGVDIIKNLGELVSGMLISTILFLVFGVIVIALVAMLFFRILMMWLYAMLSPLFTFKFVLAGKWWKDAWWDLFEIQEFIGTAFIPAVVGLILSFGLIVAGTVQSGTTASSQQMATKEACNEDKLKSPEGCKIMNIMWSPNNFWTYRVNNKEDYKSKIGEDGKVKEWQSLQTISTLNFGVQDKEADTGVRIHFYGSLGAGQKVSVDDVNILGTLGGIIVQFISIIFIWVAFMAIGRTSKIAGQIIRPFQDISGKITKGAVQSIPVPLVGNISGIGKVAQRIESAAEVRRNNVVANSALGRATGIQYQEVNVQNAISIYKANPSNYANFNNAIKELKDSQYNAQQKAEAVQDMMMTLLTNEKNKDKRREIMAKMKINESIIKELEDLQWKEQIEAKLKQIFNANSAPKFIENPKIDHGSLVSTTTNSTAASVNTNQTNPENGNNNNNTSNSQNQQNNNNGSGQN